MPDKKRNLEEENLMNLLSAALEAPVGADASPQPAARRRWWPRLLAAAALILAAVLAAVWLLPSKPGAPGTVTFRVLTLSFPELQAETLKRLREVETLVITITITQDSQEQVLHAYYKKPHSLRYDLTSSTAVISDETRSLVLDFQNKKVLEVRPSAFEKGSIEDLVVGPQFKATAKEFPGLKVSPAVADTVDGKPCARFDFEMTFPAEPGPQEPQTRVTGSHWFSSETQLLLRSENRMAGRVQRSDFQYNVPVDDSLFVVPDWARVAK
jgi:outer membrane lipoprotein-sorting protein